MIARCPSCGGTYRGRLGACPLDGATLVAAPVVERLLGAHTLGDEIGRGSQAVVHAASGPLGRVAVKILSRPRDVRARERFLREARAAARIDHPAVVRVHEVAETDDGGAYLVMELCEDGPLSTRALPLDPVEAARVVGVLAEALAAAHAAGVVHRDVKPSNVVFQGAQPKLCDFGLARAAGEPAMTATGELVGSPFYMAPETVSSPAVAASDVYALGCLAFALFSGAPPFVGPVRRVLAAHAADVVTLPPFVPDVVARMLEKRPDDRPSARDVARVLNAPSSSP